MILVVRGILISTVSKSENNIEGTSTTLKAIPYISTIMLTRCGILKSDQSNTKSTVVEAFAVAYFDGNMIIAIFSIIHGSIVQ